MSKTYHKVIRCGVCVGSNTTYYRARRRTFRRNAKQYLRIKLENFIHPEKLRKFKNSWDEPTDGSYLVNWDYIKNDLYNALSGHPDYTLDDVYYDMKHFGRYLKSTKFSKRNLKKYKN